MVNILMILPLLIMLAAFGLYIWQAVWVAMDSRKKGEEYWWLWTIVAMLTFPVGVIVYALVTRSNVSRCNNCGKEVPSNINSCPYCGETCGQICINCGQKVQSGWKYCPNCTTALPEDIAFAPKVKNNRIIIIIISFFVVIFLLIGGLILMYGVNTFESSKTITEEVSLSGATEQISYSDSGEFFSRNSYDEPHTDTRSYTLVGENVYKISYEGERKGGYVIVKIYDSNDKLLAETQKLNSKEIDGILDGGLASYGTAKVVVEFNNYEGSFYLSK